MSIGTMPDSSSACRQSGQVWIGTSAILVFPRRSFGLALPRRDRVTADLGRRKALLAFVVERTDQAIRLLQGHDHRNRARPFGLVERHNRAGKILVHTPEVLHIDQRKSRSGLASHARAKLFPSATPVNGSFPQKEIGRASC